MRVQLSPSSSTHDVPMLLSKPAPSSMQPHDAGNVTDLFGADGAGGGGVVGGGSVGGHVIGCGSGILPGFPPPRL